MAGIKVYVPDKIEEEFRKNAMQCFGYAKGSLSAAAEEAFVMWIREVEIIQGYQLPENPVDEIAGMLAGVKKSSVELQHDASKIRAKKTEDDN